MTRKKFKIMYPEDHWDSSKAGKPYLPPTGSMIVMNNRGVFYLVSGVDDYDMVMKELSKVIYKYDVVWK